MEFLTVFAFIFTAFSVSFATADAGASDVVELTEQTIHKYIAEHDAVLVKFYAPWCMHCQSLAPEYEKAAKALKEEGVEIILAELNCDGAPAVAQEFGIEGYPTIKFFRKGNAREYNGTRQVDGIVSWCKSILLPAVVKVKNASEIDDSADITFVASGYDGSEEIMDEYEDQADIHRSDAKFFMYPDGPKEIYVIHKGDDRFMFNGVTATELAEFIQQESLPLFAEIGHANYVRYFNSGKAISWFCATTSDYEKYRSTFASVARTLRASALFAWLDVEKFTAAKEAFAIDSYPAVAHQTPTGRYILLPEIYPFNDADAILRFYSDVEAGKVPRSIKSEDEPAENNGPVLTLVGKTLADFVNKSTRPILLMIHSPFCEHCKKFMPVFTSFGENMAEDGRIVVALLNGDGNESELENIQWTAYPTVLLIKPGGKDVISYDGKRTLEDLNNFVEKHVFEERHEEF
ncbi:disulfide isomerase [Babesia ovis]|uniref:protein disulfide-isomerase n=1 Tax=Babesia ovis TaxID=5869 RepID=A0A9W5TCP9_BABOV|nr:disulfide isomerase [Babesia ovis]